MAGALMSAFFALPSILRYTSPTRTVARSLWATTTSTCSMAAMLGEIEVDVAGILAVTRGGNPPDCGLRCP